MGWEALDPPIFNDTRDVTPTFDARSRFRRHQVVGRNNSRTAVTTVV
jgi:hypothetical protein